MLYKIITSSSPEGLTKKVSEMLEQGWELLGSHIAVVSHQQNRFRGTQHIDTVNEAEYSQSLIKK